MQVDHHAEAVGPGVGGEVQALQGAGLLHAFRVGDAAAEGRVGLVDVETPLFQHGPELVPAAVQLAARDGHPGTAAQFGQVVPGVHVQRLFQPGDAVVGAGSGECAGALEVPQRGVVDQRHPPALVGVNADGHAVAHGLAHGFDLADVCGQFEVVNPQLDSPEALFRQLQHLLRALFRRVDFAGRSIDRHAAVSRQLFRLAAQHLPQGLALDLAPDVPESGLQPVVPPAQVARLAHALPAGGDVGRVESDQVGAKQVAQAGALGAEGGAGRQALHAVVGGDAGQREAVDGLRIAGDPRGVEGPGKGKGDVEQLDPVDFHHSSCGVRVNFPSSLL